MRVPKFSEGACLAGATAMLGLYVIDPVVGGAGADAAGIISISLGSTGPPTNYAGPINVTVETGLEPQKAQAEFRPSHRNSLTIKLT